LQLRYRQVKNQVVLILLKKYQDKVK